MHVTANQGISLRIGSRRALVVALAALMATMVFANRHVQAGGTARVCPPATKDGVRVIRLRRALGCNTGLRLAARVVNGDGYFQDSRYYCRWGQGGTKPIQINGRTYLAGFCYRKSDEEEVGFLARRVR